MTGDAEEASTPTMRVVLNASDVVAAGRVDNVLQVPSPIYTAEFTDAHHVLIGAGGGGRKFGMANIALLLRVRSLRSECHATTVANGRPPPAAGASSSPRPASPSTSADVSQTAAEPPVWSFAAALDLGVDIPWCTSAFLPFHADAQPSTSGSATDPAALGWSDKQRSVLQGLMGFVALSSITSFTLIGVYRGAEPTSHSAAASISASAEGEEARRYLRQLARITVPHDEKDPDKKPLALVQNVLVVAHDDNGVYAYALTDLVPDGFEDEDEEAYTAMHTAQVKPGGALQRRVPRVQTTATPVAEWRLPARVNDLSANRVCLVQAERADAELAASTPCKAHVHEHLILAALLQNKTAVLGTLRLRRKYSHKSRGAEEARSTSINSAASISTALTLSGAELPVPFKLLTSSLRLVRLYGWDNIEADQQAAMRRQLTWQSLQEKGALTKGPLCSVAMVVFNTHACESFLLHGAIDVTPLSANLSKSSGELALKLRWAQPHPTPVLADAITSLSVCADAVPGDYEARVRRSPVGAAVPLHFIVGTVEGWVASVRWEAKERRWRSDHVRPSPLKSIAQRFPALHKEPVSCVAVSAENDVVSADIAQNVALTTVPYALRASSASHGAAAAGASATKPEDRVSAGRDQASAYAIQPRIATSSALFPASLSDSGLLGWVLTELMSGSVSARGFMFLAVPLLLLLVAMIFSMR